MTLSFQGREHVRDRLLIHRGVRRHVMDRSIQPTDATTVITNTIRTSVQMLHFIGRSTRPSVRFSEGQSRFR